MDSAKPASFNARSSALVPLAMAVAALYVGREILLPFALAILISFLLAPLVERLEKWKVGRVPSVIAVVSLAFLTMAALAYVVALQAYDLAYNLPEYKGNIVQKARSFQGSEGGVWERASNALEEVQADLTNQPTTDADDKDPSAPSGPGIRRTLDSQSTASDVLPGRPPVPVEVIETLSAQEIAQSILGPIVSPLGAAAMVMIFVVFMLLEREDLRNRLIHLVGAKQLNLTTQAMDDAAHRVSRYLLMQLIINVAYGLVIAVGLFLIGLPNAFLWGALTAVLRFIPYVGPWIAAVMPLTLSLAVFDGWTQPTMVLSLFIANELVSNNVLEPWLYGARTGISTIGILASAVFWSWLWGPVGLVMATPLTVCLTVVGRYVPQLRFLNTLISDDEILPPQARFYQRMLAMDPEEATEVAEDYFNDHTLEELYDSVLLPALSLAEQDRHRGELDEVKQRFVHRTTREIVEDMGVRSQAASAAESPSPTSSDRPPVLCLPARDEADEIVGMMLVQLLEQRGVGAQVLSTKTLSSEMLSEVEAKFVNIVCISALPPFAATHARYLCKRLRPKFPALKITVGLWRTDASAKSRDRLSLAGADHLAATLSEAAAMLSALAASQPIPTTVSTTSIDG